MSESAGGFRVRVNTWAQFETRVRDKAPHLLARLPRFPDAILVAGCQRSGTTAVTRIIRDVIAMPPLELTRDDELDAALILSGFASSEYGGRHCFQTTYLNDRLEEYFDHESFRLVWILRNPQAVIQSMLYNWRRAALRRLFRRCGSTQLDQRGLRRFRQFGTLPFSRLQMACLSYNAKTDQTHVLHGRLDANRLMVIDYDDLLDRKNEVLPEMFSFVGVPFQDEVLARLRRSSKSQKSRLSNQALDYIEGLCMPCYERARVLARTDDRDSSG
jgi:hypothetical protein